MTEAEKQTEYVEADWLRDTAWRWVLWHPPHDIWDHDHCFFCDVRISDRPSFADDLRECWRHDYPAEPGNYESVCAACFEELRNTFRWTILPSDPFNSGASG